MRKAPKGTHARIPRLGDDAGAAELLSWRKSLIHEGPLSALPAISPSAITRLGAGDGVGALLGALERDGVVIVERAADEATRARVNADLDPWFKAAFHGNGLFFGKYTRRFGGLFAKAPSTAALALHPLVLEATETLLRGPADAPHCDVVELNLAQAIGIEPGEKPQFLHRDDDLWPWRPPFDVMVNVMWALDEFTLDNGATRFIPGSHHWPRDKRRGDCSAGTRQAIAPVDQMRPAAAL